MVNARNNIPPIEENTSVLGADRDNAVIETNPENGPDPDTMRKAWSQPGHEADAYRASRIGTPGSGEGFDELTAAETPETTRYLGDASLSNPKEGSIRERPDRNESRSGGSRQAAAPADRPGPDEGSIGRGSSAARGRKG